MYIRSKGRGKWQCVWEVRDPLTGRRRRITQIVTGTKKDAERVWTARQADLQARPAPRTPADWPARPDTWTVADLCQHWLTVAEIDDTTRARYADLVRYQIAPTLGAIRVCDLHPAQVQAAERAWLTGGRADGRGGLSASSVRQAHAVLQGALRQAVAWGWIPANPLQQVRRPRHEAAEPHVWTPAEIAAFARVARRHRHGRLFLIVLRTGLRQSEALGLRWADVDWAGAALHVRQQLLPTGAFGPLKTARARRTIAIDGTTLAWLRQEQAAQRADRLVCGPVYQDHGLVFQTRVGTPFRHRNVVRLLRRLERAAGVPPIRFHDLRHTHASLLIAHGADPRLVADRLGHAQVAFTLQVYSHLWPNRQADLLRHLPAFDADG